MQVVHNDRRRVDPFGFLAGDVESLSMVKEFLDSKGRNSQGTKITYRFGIKHFKNFLDTRYGYPITIGNIVKKIINKELDVYQVINNFISYLTSLDRKINNRTVIYYVNSINSYLQFYDVDIIPRKLKQRVVIPKQYHEDEQAIDQEDIREILKACNNRRLKPYLYVLASGGMRANEALNLRLKDVYFSESPTKIHIRKENKTKRPRDIFISDEATKYLKQWIEWKYRKRRIGTKMVTPEKSGDHHIFTMEIRESPNPASFYPRLNEAFRKLLKSIGFDERKEDSYRGKITLNSFRRFVYSTMSTYDPAYAEWFLGHAKSPYWQLKEEKRRDIYKKCMKYLTFLDFPTVEAVGKDFESKLEERDQEVEGLKNRLESIEEERDYLKESRDQIDQNREKTTKILMRVLKERDEQEEILNKKFAKLDAALEKVEAAEEKLGIGQRKVKSLKQKQ